MAVIVVSVGIKLLAMNQKRRTATAGNHFTEELVVDPVIAAGQARIGCVARRADSVVVPV